MPELTQCPQCQRKLNVQESQLGQTVQCPVCGAYFTAEAAAAPRRPAAPAPAPEREPAPRERRDDRRRDDRDRDYDDERRPRRGRDDDYDDDRRPRYDRRDEYRRRGYRDYGGYGDYRPHRGATVLVLGILSIVFCFPPVGWILGGIACGMGNTDMSQMNRGEMDPSGRGPTQGGLICGIIGLVLTSLACLPCLGAFIEALNH
jgi:hypothetical protein